MFHRWVSCLGVVLFSAALVQANSAQNITAAKRVSDKLPVTTRSAQAREHFEKAMQNLEELRDADSLRELRSAVKSDPKFAQALILISHLSNDPREQKATLVQAQHLAARVTPAERLLIRWLGDVQEDNYVPAIAAMNDLLAAYPRDQRLAFLAGRWLVIQERYAQGVVVLERAVTLHPNYPAALNELAYAYAFSGDFEKAFAAMDRYVALEPNQPNPYDSYGELLRLAGKFNAALEQYRKSIRLDPNFGSELGLADTYAVMGKEKEAREEYARALLFVSSEGERVEYELQAATTWIRENNREQAERTLHHVAEHAHAAGFARLEAEAHRILAMYDPEYSAALNEIQAAQSALEGQEISRSDRAEEQARILRVLTTRSAEAGVMDSASRALRQLESMAKSSRSQVIQLSYHAAAGAVLLAQGKYSEAISHLEEDSEGPQSMRLLWQAYNRTEKVEQAAGLAARLTTLNVPTPEQALVVPKFRASVVSQAHQP